MIWSTPRRFVRFNALAEQFDGEFAVGTGRVVFQVRQLGHIGHEPRHAVAVRLAVARDIEPDDALGLFVLEFL